MISINKEDMELAEQALAGMPGAVNKAAARAINRAIIKAKTNAVKKVTAEYYISANRVDETIKVKKSTASILQGSVFSRGRSRALSYFRINPSQTGQKPKDGIFAQVKKSSTGGYIQRGFFTKFRSGHKAVVERVGKSSLPVKELVGPSVPSMLGNKSVREYIDPIAEKELNDAFTHEVNAYLKGYVR